jgi:hypothetical protein
MVALGARTSLDALLVELGVDRVRARLLRVHGLPELDEARVVRSAAERAGTMTGRKRGRLVEEEQLGELARLEQPSSPPVLELKLARDPAAAVEAPADPACVVMETATVPVNEPSLRGGDQLAEGSDAILAHAPQG